MVIKYIYFINLKLMIVFLEVNLLKEKLNMCSKKSVKFNIFVYVFICLIIIGMIFFVINVLIRNVLE